MNSWKLVANQAGQDCVQPTVSVVVSLYNYSAYIRSCLDSVSVSKTHGLPGGFEVVVVDDRSTDDSVKVIEQYMAASPMPIRLVTKQANSGLADTRNLGLVLARAPLVFILDADNEIRPDCLREHYLALVKSDHAMAYGIINRFDNATRASSGTLSDCAWETARLLGGPCIDAMAMIRRETVLHHGGYSTEYGSFLPQGWEDYDLWLKLAQAGHSGIFISKVLSDYRVHGQSMLQKLTPYQGRLAAHFTKKFLPLVARHADLPVLFGIPRQELAVYCAEGRGMQFQFEKRPARFIHHVLGQKFSRSLCKRLAALYCWLHP